MRPDELLLELFAGPADPYPIYAQMRALAPVHASEAGPLWVLSDFEPCHLALRDHRLGKRPLDHPTTIFGEPMDGPVEPVLEPSMLFLNPPAHTRLRGLVSRAFTPRRVEELRPEVTAMVDEICDEMADHRTVDVMDVLAFNLPSRVIAAMVGVPHEDRDWFRPTVRAAAQTLEPVVSDDEMAAAREALLAMRDYFVDLIAAKRASPGDDLLSDLIAVRDGSDRLSEGEMISTVTLLFSAGFETTTNLIGNGLLALLRHPDQLHALRADGSLMGNAVEEILRYDSPVQIDGRYVFEPIELGGREIPAGVEVITLLGAANRDPAEYDDPDRFDIERQIPRILSFGTGIHYCLGAALARLEGVETFDRLLDRFRLIELVDDDPPWRKTITLRGLDALEVALTPA